LAIDLPPLPPPPPIGRVQVVDEEGRATQAFADWLAKLDYYLRHLSPTSPAETRPRAQQSLADWLRARMP
jgi:hypothetical protein